MLISDIPLLLIPACALLNHLGGQSTSIPSPRIVCRVFGIPIVFTLAAYFSGTPLEAVKYSGLICFLGMALWAIPGWAQGFMALPYTRGSVWPADGRNYKSNAWLVHFCDILMGVNSLTKLSLYQCREWGIVFMTLRGAFMYPMFCALAGLLTPWATVIGAFCLLQGAVYGTAKTVASAEWRFGTLIGAALCAVLMIR